MDCTVTGPCATPDAGCKCFTYSDSELPSMDQFCARVDADGTILPCAPSCCNNGAGCPGQCRGVSARTPEGIKNVAAIAYETVASADERLDYFEKLFKVLVALLIISTLSLFIRT